MSAVQKETNKRTKKQRTNGFLNKPTNKCAKAFLLNDCIALGVHFSFHFVEDNIQGMKERRPNLIRVRHNAPDTTSQLVALNKIDFLWVDLRRCAGEYTLADAQARHRFCVDVAFRENDLFSERNFSIIEVIV